MMEKSSVKTSRKGLPLHPLGEPSLVIPCEDSGREVGKRFFLSSSCAEARRSDLSKKSPLMRSKSIPISGIKRSPSELQLLEEEQMADLRDYVMFTRIVDRLAKQQQRTQDFRCRRENDLCMAHVISTRNGQKGEDNKFLNIYNGKLHESQEQAEASNWLPWGQDSQHHHYLPWMLTGRPVVEEEDEEEIFELDL